MKSPIIIKINDKYNPIKKWVLKVYKSSHFYLNQEIQGNLIYTRFSKITKKELLKLELINNLDLIINLKRKKEKKYGL